MIMTATQFNRNCQNFVTLLQKSQQFEGVKYLLNQWKQKNKPAIGAIDTFMRMAQLFKQDQDLVQQFNKCLVKEASIPKKPSTNLQIKQLALQNQKSGPLLDMVLNWIKNDEIQKVPQILVPPPNQPIIPPKLQQLTQTQFLARLQKNRFLNQISQILSLYRKCIISVKQFKSMIEPIYLTDPSVFNMMFQYAQQLQSARRKVTIFAPLTDLVDEKYPVQQVGNSYIVIPDGYANYSHTWVKNPLQKVLNRYCCSVPLGSEGSFIIARKNQFEESLFKNQQQKYQIDQNICMLRAAISNIKKNKNLNTPLLQKLLAKIYPIQNVFNIMISHPQIATNIIFPRLNQKLQQLIKCKNNFKKQCQQVSLKNFPKSLDYRCFYFRKNDKKYNSIPRWQKQIQLRKIQITQNIQQKYRQQNKQYQDQINDRQALQTTRSYLVNTFNNITKQQILQQRKVDLSQYDRKFSASYPKYPDNQILFIISFDNDQIFNDVLQIVLYHCQKKSIFELIILKVFKKIIKRNLIKDSSILAYIDMKTQKNININQVYQNNQNSNYQQNQNNSNQPLNQPRKDKKIYKDITEQFFDFIQEEIDSIKLQQIDNPFEGPNEHTFIGTKTIYNIVRFLLTIYQRFLKAKELSDSLKNQSLSFKKQSSFEQNNQITLYQQFLAILIFKVKDTKQLFEEYLRKIMNQQTFIYFTLDKFIINLVKLINNINNDSLTYKILKDQIKDYQIGVKKWEQYQFQSITKQLTKLYSQSQTLFRFTFSSTYLMYISTWQNNHVLSAMSQKDKQKIQNKKQNVYLQKQSNIDEIIFNYMTYNNKNIKKKIEFSHKHHQHNNVKNGKNKKQLNQQKYQILKIQNAEYTNLNQGIFLMKGQEIMLKYKRANLSIKRNKQDCQYIKQLDRLRKFIKRI